MLIEASAIHQNFLSSVIDTVNSSFNDWYVLIKRNIKQMVPQTAMIGFVHPHKKQMTGKIINNSAENINARSILMAFVVSPTASLLIPFHF